MWTFLLAARAAEPPAPVDLTEPGDEAALRAAFDAPLPLPDAPTDASAPPPLLELTGPERISTDLEVFVRSDGNLYLRDQLVLEVDLARILSAELAQRPDARVVIAGDAGAPFEALVSVVQLARASGAVHTALTVDGLDVAAPVDPLFPTADAEVEPLDGGLTAGQTHELSPKRHKFPQSPYANTSSYTAYTLERGETKLGPFAFQTGVARRLQIGTAELLDLVGAVNVNVKANLTRVGPFDGALLCQYYYVPLGGLLRGIGAEDWFDGREGGSDTVRAAYLGLGATGSLQLAGPWSMHGQLYWARPSARGDISFDDLPEVLLPGLTAGNTGMVGLGVVGDLGVVNLATDYRFNRRDSVFAWLRYPFYGRVRGIGSPQVQGLDNLGNADLIVAYGDTIPFTQSYSFAAGYQGSWKHVEARAGLGLSGVKLTWLFQAFELSYKFGGTTRRQERKIRDGYGAMPMDDR